MVRFLVIVGRGCWKILALLIGQHMAFQSRDMLRDNC